MATDEEALAGIKRWLDEVRLSCERLRVAEDAGQGAVTSGPRTYPEGYLERLARSRESAERAITLMVDDASLDVRVAETMWVLYIDGTPWSELPQRMGLSKTTAKRLRHRGIAWMADHEGLLPEGVGAVAGGASAPEGAPPLPRLTR